MGFDTNPCDTPYQSQLVFSLTVSFSHNRPQITAVEGTQADLWKVKRALLSVSDKTGLLELATFLVEQGVELLSTGGTAKVIREAGLPVKDVSEYTGAPEILDGRVKTLHPKVHGGLLGVRGNPTHESQMAENGISNIDVVVLNLYAFEHTVQKGGDFATCIENIDIGGPSMLRSSAKNHKYVVIATSPSQYGELMAEMKAQGGSTSLALRKRFAARAFATSAAYDSAIAGWINGQLGEAAPVVTRVYTPQFPLKYGCNPHQAPAGILSILGTPLPFQVLNGTPGYINLLDALNAYQLVRELRAALGLAAAASFKHVSPAGAGVAVPLSAEEAQAYEVGDPGALTPVALAYIRARGADPMCSFGDFAAVSDVVDEATAKVLQKEVSDGIIAPGYEPAALQILASKKQGKFIVLQATADFTPPPVEYREVYGAAFKQRRNDAFLSPSDLSKVVTTAQLPEEAVRDLTIASIAIKYTQSNSVGYALNGQVIGVGAGQQSRVDCVKLAGRKVEIWWLRQHPKVRSLAFKPTVKRQDRVNARVRYIEGDITAAERPLWEANFEDVPSPLTEDEKAAFMGTLQGVSLSSDAFFPFRDSIDHASKYGVTYVVQPGGSVQDTQVTECCNSYGMAMAFTNVRLFHH
jgi:phosphoribosylaminoimidazolecarboxamide formyltransferase/IMP cyclohydrolase